LRPLWMQWRAWICIMVRNRGGQSQRVCSGRSTGICAAPEKVDGRSRKRNPWNIKWLWRSNSTASLPQPHHRQTHPLEKPSQSITHQLKSLPPPFKMPSITNSVIMRSSSPSFLPSRLYHPAEIHSLTAALLEPARPCESNSS
jgi:hypothetical protein